MKPFCINLKLYLAGKDVHVDLNRYIVAVDFQHSHQARNTLFGFVLNSKHCII